MRLKIIKPLWFIKIASQAKHSCINNSSITTICHGSIFHPVRILTYRFKIKLLVLMSFQLTPRGGDIGKRDFVELQMTPIGYQTVAYLCYEYFLFSHIKRTYPIPSVKL